MDSTQKLSAVLTYPGTACITRKESYATEMTKLLRPHESHVVVQDWGFVSHCSVLAGGEMDVCRWAAGIVQSCPWSHLAITTGIGTNSTWSVQQSWGRSQHPPNKPISKGQTWCQMPPFSFPISVFFLRCCKVSQSCQLEYARKP